MLAAPALPVRAGMRPEGPACGTLICAGRNDHRWAVADLPDGEGGWYLITEDRDTDPINPPDGGYDAGIIRLGPDLSSRPVNDGPGGDDPCGALLVGGAGSQTPMSALKLGSDRYVLAGQELGQGTLFPRRVFAWGFDGAAGTTFDDPFVTPAPFDVETREPRIAPDGRGGFYLAWQQSPHVQSPEIDVLVARYDSLGRALWPAPVRMGREITAMRIEAVVADLTGGVWVAWIDWPPDAPLGQPQHTVQHLREDGTTTLPAGGVPVDPMRETDSGSTTALLAVPGGVLAATEVQYGIAAHFIGETGQRFWGAGGRFLSPRQITEVSDLRFLQAPDGSVRLLWEEDPGDRSTMSVVRFELDGTTPWPAPAFLLDLGLLDGGTDFTMLGDGTLVAAAGAYRDLSGSDPFDLVAQAIDGRGRVKSRAGGEAVCAAPGTQGAPRILPADDDVIRIFWTDTRPGYGVEHGANYFAGAVTFSSNPMLVPVAAPIEIRQGEATTIFLAGDDLDGTAAISPGDGVRAMSAMVTPIDPKAPGDRLTLALRADPGAAVGTRALVVTNPDGESATLPAYLRITLDARRIDIDGSGRTDGFDLVLLASSFGRARGEADYKPGADIDGSGVVDGVDLALLAGRFGGPPD